jgi:hypothetical protein
LRITETGLDFLEDDGGIGAILRTVTVKLDADQLRKILAAKVQALPIPEEKKASVLSTVRNLPSEILNKLVMKFVERGIDHFPDLLELLQSLSSSPSGGPPPPGIIV